MQKHYKVGRVLDIGCGVDLPLAKLLYSSRLIVRDYVGLDYNKSHKFDLSAFHSGKFPVQAYGHVDFADDSQVRVAPPEALVGQTSDALVMHLDGDVLAGEHELPNVITCFEVVEHIEPDHVIRLLKKVKSIMEETASIKGEDPVFFVSTPCYDSDVGHADNHVNEMRYGALGWLIEEVGFRIERNYGTFASQRDYKPELLKQYGLNVVWDELSSYYDSNYLATIFAPLFPHLSRNAIWVLRLPKNGSEGIRSFPTMDGVKEPWTSSANWSDLANV